ncbi:Kremen protein 1 [Collichthys lucidus]|uniref:Kremen protein 1 n=1 Tax=Collichthys lucidus TaxID=240159 RepID=A0A4U5UTQ7_COLLU|nr:Kremen protein 1 [Collichthys lucidus]
MVCSSVNLLLKIRINLEIADAQKEQESFCLGTWAASKTAVIHPLCPAPARPPTNSQSRTVSASVGSRDTSTADVTGCGSRLASSAHPWIVTVLNAHVKRQCWEAQIPCDCLTKSMPDELDSDPSLVCSLAGMESGYACFCGNEVDPRDHGESPAMECNHVCFGDHTQPCGGDGWVIIFDTRVGACGGNYSSPSGVIYSPDFPDKYNPGRVCYWTIQVPGSSAILFNFTFFEISDQTDMVELLDGYSNQVVARFDWRSPPRELVNVTGDFVILYFYSDRTNQAQGFALLYQALRSQDTRTLDAGGDDDDEGENVSSTAGPQLAGSVTERSNSTSNGRSSQILYVITSSPGKPEHNMPVWTIYALAALLVLTVIAMVAKLLLHITVKSPNIPTVSGSDSCSQSTASSEPWIILYRPSTISLFKKKLKNHHGDLSPLFRKQGGLPLPGASERQLNLHHYQGEDEVMESLIHACCTT